MKISYVVILILATAVIAAGLSYLVTSHTGTAAERAVFEDRSSADPEQMIENMISYLYESDPARADALKEMREKDPERFRAMMREQTGSRRRGKHFGPEGTAPGPFAGRRGPMRMHQKQAEFVDWLKENYSEEARELEKLKEKSPRLYHRRLALSVKKYGRIAETERKNPQLAAILKEKINLNELRDDLLRKFKTADENRKKMLVEELHKVVGQKFDLIVRQKQTAYEQLREKLGDLEEKVKASEAELAKRQDAEFKNENINARVEELLSGIEKFNWD